jgi:HrpA-like RNA helicase
MTRRSISDRSYAQDFLCLLLKRLLFAAASSTSAAAAAASAAPATTTRLVVMSATLQSSLFGEYFSTPGGSELDRREEEEEDEPIFVGVGRFPVEIFYADDIAEGAMGVLDAKVKKSASQVAGRGLHSFPFQSRHFPPRHRHACESLVS